MVAALAGRLAPEIAKAFQVQVAHLDRILVARYDDAGGFFRRHRDNSSAHLAYRELRRVREPEHTATIPAASCCFPSTTTTGTARLRGRPWSSSASLLHEAAPVRRGTRYVLLTFLHSDAAEARRQAALAGVEA